MVLSTAIMLILQAPSGVAGSSHGELIVQHMMNPPPPLAEKVDAGTPDALVALVMRMLAKDKDARPTMRQVVGELDRMGGYMSGVFGTVPMPMVSGPNLVLAQMTPPPGSLAGPGAFPSMPGHPSLAGMQPTPHPSLAGQSAGSLPGVGSNPSLSGTGPGSPPPSTLGLALSFLFGLAALAFALWNYGARQGITGSSIGKAALKFKVVSERTGEPIGFGLSIVRQLAHIVDAVICYIGYLFPLWDAKRQTLADKIMTTVCLPTA